MLAAWMRMKYPHLVEGALAASAPILQFGPNFDCLSFNKIVTKDFANYSTNCAATIKKSWPVIRKLAKTESGRKTLSDTFKLCKPLKSEANASQLVDWLTNSYTYMAMTDYPNPSNFIQPMPRYPINKTCSYLNNENIPEEQLLNNIYLASSVFYNFTGQTVCNDFEASPGSLDDKIWDFQSCTEAVMPICSNGKSDFFEKQDFDFSKVYEDCKKKFNVTADANRVELLFGLGDLRYASNIIFSNGDRDPWSAGGVTIRHLKTQLHNKPNYKEIYALYKTFQQKSDNLLINKNNLVILNIPGACHHEDLRFNEPLDPPSLALARAQEIKILKTWISNYYNNLIIK